MTNTIGDEANEIKIQIKLLLFSFVLGISFDYLFYNKEVGISYPLFVGLFYALFLWRSKGQIRLHSNISWLLFGSIILLSLTYLIFANEMFHLLNGLAIPLLIATHTTYLIHPNKSKWYRAHFIRKVIEQAIPQTLIKFVIPVKVGKSLIKNRLATENYQIVGKVLLGILISVPFLVIVISLLTSADMMFNELVGSIPTLLINWNLEEAIFRLGIIFFITFYIFGYIQGLLSPRRVANPVVDLPSNEEKLFLRLDPTIAATFLTLLNVVYLLFVMVQFSYFFGGSEGRLPAGITYSEYARQGFSELMAVTVLNFSILLGVIRFVRKQRNRLSRFVQVLQSLMIGFTIVMLSSAFLRLTLYEEAYGFTRSRLLAHAFMIFLFVLFLLALYKIWQNRFALTRAYLVVAIVAYVTINYVNMDRIIAVNNLARYENTGNIDMYYLNQLSADAIPVLVNYTKDNDTIPQLNVMLERRRLNWKLENWQSFNWAEYRAEKMMRNR